MERGQAQSKHNEFSEELPASFAAFLRMYRVRANLSQDKLAELAKISSAAISALEQGIRKAPYRNTVSLIADALRLSPSERVEFEQSADRARNRGARVARGDLAPEGHLPVPLTTFVTRSDVSEIAHLVAHHRLVTITGAGGIGKTRTAIEVGSLRRSNGPDEVWFLDLSTVPAGALIGREIAVLMHLPYDDDAGALERVLAALATRRAFLIVDNCEHLTADAAAAIGSIVSRCTGVSILATSRERLHLANEVVYRLPPLVLDDAIQLFIDRAQFAGVRCTSEPDDLVAIADICRAIDGIPLAIELAAAQLPAFGLGTLRSRLHSNFSGSRDSPPRQRTMAATIAWSYDLLDDDERAVLQGLSIFSGGCTLAAAERICSSASIGENRVGELIASLHGKSLVELGRVGASDRYVLLESIRSFAADRVVQPADRERLAMRHVAWIAEFAQRFIDDEPSPAQIDDRLADLDNVRAALNECIASGREEHYVTAAHIVANLQRLWLHAGRAGELVTWATRLLEHVSEERQTHAVARLLGAMAGLDGGSEKAHAAANRALPLRPTLARDPFHGAEWTQSP